jgi:CBS domain-containing protein
MATIEPDSVNGSASAATLQYDTQTRPTKAKDIAQFGVATIDKDASVYQAVATMVKRGVSGLPVVDSTGLLGVISEKDVLKLLFDTEFVAGTVGDYMTTGVLTFDEEADLADICKCLIENNFRRVPILHQGKLSGIISRADIIRINKDKFRPYATNSDCSANPTAKDVMKTGLLTVKKAAPVYEAMDIMATKNITGLPVVDDYMNLLGIISEKDVLKLLYDPDALPTVVGDVMTQEITGFSQDASLFDICGCLIDNNFRRVPILNGGKLIGIISRTDIMAYIMKNHAKFFSQKPKS